MFESISELCGTNDCCDWIVISKLGDISSINVDEEYLVCCGDSGGEQNVIMM